MTEEIYKNLGLSYLTKPNAKIGFTTYKDEFNPSKEVLNLKLSSIIDNCTQICGFTLTLKKKFHNDDDKYIHRLVSKKIKDSKVWKDIKYMIFPEYTKKGNLHYHGIIWDEYDYTVIQLMKWWRRQFGFAKPELKLNSPYNWIQYITKDYGQVGLWTITKI